jgi:hypothetical protein
VHIFIDESGSFSAPQPGKRNLCCIGALVVPEKAYPSLAGAFNALKLSWNGGTDEVKGTKLNEAQVATVIALLIAHGCLFFVCATEMSLSDPTFVEAYQIKQGEFLTAALSEGHNLELQQEVLRLRQLYEQMPSSLLIQSILLTDLVKKVVDQATLHFVMKSPQEAGRFAWVIDAKDKQKTMYEATWERLAGGLVQGRGLESPSIAYEEGDYSFFKRFLRAASKIKEEVGVRRSGFRPEAGEHGG